MAGSRQHILEVLITRSLVFAPIFLLGFSKNVIDAYIIIVGFQAVSITPMWRAAGRYAT